jgi:alpha-tubulin suppressor-like RCC1 family protein
MDRRNGLQTTLAVLSLAVLAWNAAGQTGNVRAWGENCHGQLGNGIDCSSVYRPAAVPYLAGAVAIAAGESHSLALKSDGTVWAWGYNGRGQLGYGSYTATSEPVTVQNLQPSVVAIDAGDNHSLARMSDGTVWAWGTNDHGELGNGSNAANSSVPVRVSNFSAAVAIAAGGEHNLALRADGTVWAWGYNGYGQLGTGSTGGYSAVPVQVSNLTGVVSVAAGYGFSFARRSDGTVWAWGRNESGQLGNGTNADSNVPVMVSNLTGVVDIASAVHHSLALRSDGTVWAWGGNIYGELGSGTDNASHVPVAVLNLTGAVAIAAGGLHSLALKSDGTVWAWGAGNGSVPAAVNDLNGAAAIAAGGLHSLALKGGTVVAWGINDWGQLGNGVSAHSNVPVVVSSLSGVVTVAASAAYEEAGAKYSLALKSDGTVWEWGDGTNSNVPVRKGNLTDVVAISVGSYHVLALKKDGAVCSWTIKWYGSNTPAPVSGLSGVVAVAAGSLHSLALRSDGTVWTWRQGDVDNVPTPLTGLTGVVALAAGLEHSLALKSDGTVWAWGSGPLGNGTDTQSSVPVPVSHLTGVVAIAANYSQRLALTSDGAVWAWGYDPFGQLGNGSNVPVPVHNLTGVAITAGGWHNLVLKGDGSVWAWGANGYGELGNGSNTASLVPVEVRNLTGAVAIGAGDGYSLAAVADGIPQVILDPTDFSFGNQTAGTASAPRVLTITNTGEAPLAIHAVVLTGMHSAHFSKVTDACAGTTVPAGGRCTVSVRFAPTGAGNRSGALLITSNAPGSAHLIRLAGTGVTPPPDAPVLLSPANGATGVSLTPSLTWTPGGWADSHDVYFGAASPPPYAGTPAWRTSYAPGPLTAGATYYWQVVAKNGAGSTASPIWSFTTLAAPGAPSLAAPANGATGAPLTPTLTWTAGSGATSYDVYWGTAPSPQNIAPGVTGTSYAPGALTAGTKYYWRVVAKNSAGSTSSPTWEFTTLAAPGAPTLLAPANGATGVSLTPVLDWTGGSGATSHDVYFGTASSPPLVTNTTATSYAPSGLAAGTRYYWKVVAKNGAGSKASAVWSFTTQAAPAVPGNPSPANGATGVPVSSALTWTCTGATSYDVFFGPTSSPPYAGNTTHTVYTPQGMAAARTYYWRVVAKNSAGSTASPVWSFTTQGAPGAPTLLSPANGATGVPLTPTLAWVNGSGATSHDVYFGPTPRPPFIGNTTSNRYTTGTLNPNTTYYWLCAAKNSYGSTYSAVWSFTTTGAGAPGAATLVSPANGATGVSVRPTLMWKAAAGATSYDIFLTTSMPAGVTAGAPSADSTKNHSVVARTAETKVTMQGLLNNTRYYWWVVAKNAVGKKSSAIQYFTTR